MFFDFITKYTDIFCWKNEKSFCNAKAFHIFFQQKFLWISDINVSNFNKTLTDDVVNFEQPDPVQFSRWTKLGTLLNVQAEDSDQPMHIQRTFKSTDNLWMLSNKCHHYIENPLYSFNKTCLHLYRLACLTAAWHWQKNLEVFKN